MNDIESYRDLIVWRKSMDLVKKCYLLTRSFPPDERFGLTVQLKRAAVSIPSNIAEGHGRGTTQAYINFLWIANGSLREVETHLLIAEQLEFVEEAELMPILALADEIGRMLRGLRQSLSDGFHRPPGS